MISGGSSSSSASARVATMSGAWTVKGVVELADVFDVGLILRILAGVRLEPAVQDLAEQGLRGAAQAQREHVRVVPCPCAAGRLGIGAQRGADTDHLVGRDRGAGAGPAAHDS